MWIRQRIGGRLDGEKAAGGIQTIPKKNDPDAGTLGPIVRPTRTEPWSKNVSATGERHPLHSLATYKNPLCCDIGET